MAGAPFALHAKAMIPCTCRRHPESIHIITLQRSWARTRSDAQVFWPGCCWQCEMRILPFDAADFF